MLRETGVAPSTSALMSKAELVPAVHAIGDPAGGSPGEWRSVPRRTVEFALVERLNRNGPMLIVLEATDGYELACVAAVTRRLLTILNATARTSGGAPTYLRYSLTLKTVAYAS